MNRTCLTHFALICLLWAAVSAGAEQVSDLYRASILVPDQSEQHRDRGIRQAFSQVLVKVTGDSAALGHPAVLQGLANAENFVAAIGYSEAGDGAQPGAMLDVRFSPQLLDQLIRTEQLSVWPANRPTLLLWLVSDSVEHGLQPVGGEASSDLLEDMALLLAQRGQPFRLPNYDLQDQFVLSLQDIWALRSPQLSTASQRYATDGWAALRFFSTSSGQIRGSWIYNLGEHSGREDFIGSDRQHFMQQAISALVDTVAAHYAYTPQAASNQYLVRIEGVASYEDYQLLLQRVEALESVLSVQLAQLAGDTLTLSVEVEGDSQLLYR